ncbi:hypothetical protein [Flavobacterium sp. FlaQc-28]|uniref:hypothetical protein n=1 Tax=Flavobacterium sp. FlaQc-28 TaxID=3374178 RepID=UPI003757974B
MEKISFSQILNKESFFKLKKEFLLQDMQYGSMINTMESLALPVDTTKEDITVLRNKITTDQFEFYIYAENHSCDNRNEYIEISLNFYNDYLLPKIKSQIEYLKEKINESIGKIYYKGDIAIKNEIIEKQRSIDKLLKQVKNAKHLDSYFRTKIHHEIFELYYHLNTRYFQGNTNNEKIKFNLKKSQISVFFELMQRNGLIKGMSSNDLHRFIESNFLYFDSNSKEFKEITRSKKVVDEFFTNKTKQTSEKSPEKTLKGLKTIFTNKDFFNPE